MCSVLYLCVFFFSSRRRHTRCALVTGVQTCALPILVFGSGLVELGLEPDRFIFIIVGDITALLRAADDILRCGGAGALIVEVWGSAPALNLTASRRLALAAEKSGVTALLVRADAKIGRAHV